MGNTDLRDLAVINDISMNELAGETIAIDFHNWVYRYLTIITRFTDEEVYTRTDGQEVPNLIGIVKGLPKFTEHDLSPVFVFDGEVLELKEEEMQRRRERKEAAAARLDQAIEDGDEELAARLRARTQRLTPVILETSRTLLEILDFPIVDAPAEAEAQAAQLARNSDVEYVGTEDYDALLFGSPYTIRQLTSKEDPECMELAATLSELDISRSELVEIAILCGTDYNDGVYGVGPKTALSAVSDGQRVEDILADRDAEIPELDAIRDIYLNPTVSSDYEIDWDWSPDIDRAHSFLTDEWGLPPAELETAFERLSEANDNS